MKALSAVLATSAGKKALVAASGLSLSVWCVLHILGNGAAFAGPAALDGYAAWLRSASGVPLWGMRFLLLLVVVAHVALALVSWRRARAARPVAYAIARPAAAGLAARALRVGGVALGLFTVLHVAHINYGLGLPGFVPGRVYDSLRSAFTSPGWVLAYVAAALALGLHLAHGLGAALSSL